MCVCASVLESLTLLPSILGPTSTPILHDLSPMLLSTQRVTGLGLGEFDGVNDCHGVTLLGNPVLGYQSQGPCVSLVVRYVYTFLSHRSIACFRFLAVREWETRASGPGCAGRAEWWDNTAQHHTPYLSPRSRDWC